MQHPRIFGWGHIGRGRTNIAPFIKVGSYSYDMTQLYFVTKKTGYSDDKEANRIALDYEIGKTRSFLRVSANKSLRLMGVA
jgi:hypothetical protein